MNDIKAPDLLNKAASIMASRAKEYDQPEGERSAARIVAAFNAITGHQLTESQGWLFLQILKQVRLFSAAGFHADSADDNIAYAALLAEAKAQEKDAPAKVDPERKAYGLRVARAVRRACADATGGDWDFFGVNLHAIVDKLENAK
jgi:hypothetical protein